MFIVFDCWRDSCLLPYCILRLLTRAADLIISPTLSTALSRRCSTLPFDLTDALRRGPVNTGAGTRTRRHALLWPVPKFEFTEWKRLTAGHLNQPPHHSCSASCPDSFQCECGTMPSQKVTKLVMCNDNNDEYLMTVKILCLKQNRSSVYLPLKKNEEATNSVDLTRGEIDGHSILHSPQ